MNMKDGFFEVKLFQVKPGKLVEFEALVAHIAEQQKQQPGCLDIKYGKRFFTIDGVDKGAPPRELTKIVKCVKYFSYWEFDTKENYGRYEWKITGGYFEKWGQRVTEIYEFNWANVTVIWNNVKSINGSVPKGTITLNIYNKNDQSTVVDNGSSEQKIKSLNEILPQTPQSSETALNYGIQTIRVT